MTLLVPACVSVGRSFRVVDMHTCGEPLRIFDAKSAVEIPPGLTILEKRRFFQEKHDDIRTALMLEPRGHDGMYGAYIVPSDIEGAHFGVLFVHQSGYSIMCGHAMVALGRYAVDYKLVPPTGAETEVNIECPCGLVTCHVDTSAGTSGDVRFESVPSFAVKLDLPVTIDRFGSAPFLVDISYGGTYYVIAEDQKILGKALSDSKTHEVVDCASELIDHLRQTLTLEHPDNPDLAFLYGCIVTEGEKNTVIFGEGQVDRSPCGSGVTARAALEYAKGNVKVGDSKRFVSGVTGGVFMATVVRAEGSHVVVQVKGRAHYVGTAEFVLEQGDELGSGFSLK